ncbi:antibiotic biosynthesis monooxygenase family protein [Luteibaculum oceani]|uniref:DUF4188 domain-containing protein n=1 Tax=Luteibaculum oceani TaxID=1294296 RepID=A0A5C6VLG6_9FLAO|nr:DUF4188 domain-containing protein [Luteibaculum oceani]TXC85266.1 DUF4188 domain-containing protein [Luteibaculum oceani]
MEIPKKITPPYWAVIFSSKKRNNDPEFTKVSDYLDEIVVKQEGYLGHETVGQDPSITISYWKDMESIKKWRNHPDHHAAIERSRKEWFEYYNIKIAEVKGGHYWEHR